MTQAAKTATGEYSEKQGCVQRVEAADRDGALSTTLKLQNHDMFVVTAS